MEFGSKSSSCEDGFEKTEALSQTVKYYPPIDDIHNQGISYLKLHPYIPNISIYNAIRYGSLFYRHSSAINCDGIRITYEGLLKNAGIIAKALTVLGVKKGDIVTVAMPNYEQAVEMFLAVNKIGAVTTFLNYFAETEEIIGYLKLFESPLFFTYDPIADHSETIFRETHVRHIIVLHDEELRSKGFKTESHDINSQNKLISYGELGTISRASKNVSSDFGLSQDALILFTSGTTGNPKSVVLTNGNLLYSAIFQKNTTGISTSTSEKSLVCVPFCYPYGFVTSTLLTILSGREAILAPMLTAENIQIYISKKPNIIFGSPALLELIMRNIEPNKELSSVKIFISGGDFLTADQKEKGKEFFIKHGADIQICNGSGNAETVGTSTTAVGIKEKPETVGRVLIGMDAIILNTETGKEAAYGEEGMLCVSGRNVFKEYYKEPELTQDAKFEYKGKIYFKTGTRGFLDTEGYFTLTGRDSRYYIMSTLNKIYCDHVQGIISAIDCVEACAVVKKPDRDLLYTNMAFIILKDGWEKNQDTIAHIKECCGRQQKMPDGTYSQLKPYEIPSAFEFMDTFPRTRADKIDYKTLEEKAAKSE